jgi:hypothetical protein
VAHSEKKPWTKPELNWFETSEELLAYFGLRARSAERERLEELVEQAQNIRGSRARQGKLRRNADR